MFNSKLIIGRRWTALIPGGGGKGPSVLGRRRIDLESDVSTSAILLTETSWASHLSGDTFPVL